jgi:ribonuclease HI
MTYNPHAIYVHCDGAMDYDSKCTGGVGYKIEFPDFVDLESIQESIGRYHGANIERVELEAIIQGMEEILRICKNNKEKLRNVKQVIFVTDRFALQDSDRTNPYKVKEWRSNKWHNHEGKPIKNSDLLDKLDKTRKKICESLYCRVEIIFKPRKFNKAVDKLAKKGKSYPIINETIAVKSTKTSKRLFDGNLIDYKLLKDKEEYSIHIYRKEPVLEQWEIFAEIIEGNFSGRKMKIYVDNLIAAKLQRQHKYKVRLKTIYRYHCTIFRTIIEIKSKPSNINTQVSYFKSNLKNNINE